MNFRFIPGTSASDMHYQVYLLEGVTRWNQARALAAIQQQQPQFLRTFDLRLADKVYSSSLFGVLELNCFFTLGQQS